MDSTRVTEHPTSHERRQSGAGRPSTPADPRGALLHTPEVLRAPGGLPAQPARSGDAPAGPAAPHGRPGTPGTQASASTDAPSPSGTGAPTPPASPGPEHSQPSAAEPDPHRPRPAPEGIPAQPVDQDRAPASGGKDRRTGQAVPHTGPMPMRRDGDRLRFVGAATRRIARGIDLDEIVMGLCRATVPTFSDAILVYLRDPLPVGDERPTGPLVLRLRRTDRIPEERDTENGFLPALRPEPSELSAMTAELCEVRPGGALAEVLRGVRPVFADAPAARAALPELLGDELAVPSGQRAILAPLRGRRRVIGAALFVRRPERMAFESDDLLVAAQLATHSALGIDKAVLYG
ncbi:serine/threonine protein phosphatase, partial [Streptomyces sp. NPDC001089]